MRASLVRFVVNGRARRGWPTHLPEPDRLLLQVSSQMPLSLELHLPGQRGSLGHAPRAWQGGGGTVRTLSLATSAAPPPSEELPASNSTLNCWPADSPAGTTTEW